MATDFTFAYGSNMNRSEIRSWLEANGYDSSLIVEATVATLEGYGYVWNYYSRGKACGTANLEPKENSVVWGVLLEFEEDLLKAFDRKEGHPYAYSRGDHRVAVRRHQDGKNVLAWLYRASPNKGGRIDVWPTRDYKKVIIEAAEFWQFPEDYIEKLKAWPAQ